MRNGKDFKRDLYHSKEREKLYKEMYFKSATEPSQREAILGIIGFCEENGYNTARSSVSRRMNGVTM